MKRPIALLFALGMLPGAGLQAQQVVTQSIRVTATVVESCDVIAPDLALVSRAARLLRATCTPATTYLIGPNNARTVIPVNPTGTATVTGVGTGEAVEHTVFGGIPAARVIPPLDSTDTVSVRVFY